jgi:hypothetical protein
MGCLPIGILNEDFAEVQRAKDRISAREIALEPRQVRDIDSALGARRFAFTLATSRRK